MPPNVFSKIVWQSSMPAVSSNPSKPPSLASTTAKPHRFSSLLQPAKSTIDSLYRYVEAAASLSSQTSSEHNKLLPRSMNRPLRLSTSSSTSSTTPTTKSFSTTSKKSGQNGGRPVRIAWMQPHHQTSINGGGGADEEDASRLTFDRHALQQLLCDESVRNLPVCVICVFGAYGTGKSFLLNFILQHLKCLSSQQQNRYDKDRADGFEWCSNPDTTTEGMVAWSEPIIIDSIPSKTTAASRRGTTKSQKFAVILLDTQGTFDMRSSTRATFSIVGLGLLLSSMLIHNIQNKFGSNDLQQLRFFTEYSKSAIQDPSNVGGAHPFQLLLTLIRDWQHPHKFSYGSEGGQQFLDKCRNDQNQPIREFTGNSDLRQVFTHLHQCFDSWKCCLLPHPGKNITRKDFSGELSELDEDFQGEVTKFIQQTFSRNALLIKKVGGEQKQVTCSLLYGYALACIEQLANHQHMPTIKQWVDCTATLHNREACDDAHRLYSSTLTHMEPYPVSDHQFVLYHKQAAEVATNAYVRRAIGSPTCVQSERQRLQHYVTETFSLCRQENEVNHCAVERALKLYDECMNAASEEFPLSDGDGRLQQLHDRAWTAAKRAFDAAGKRGSSACVEKCVLRLESELRVRQLVNEERNARFFAAVTSGVQTYNEYMERTLPAYRIMDVTFDDIHDKAAKLALEAFCAMAKRRGGSASTKSNKRKIEDDDDDFARSCTNTLTKQIHLTSADYRVENEAKHWKLVYYMLWVVRSVFPVWKRS